MNASVYSHSDVGVIPSRTKCYAVKNLILPPKERNRQTSSGDVNDETQLGCVGEVLIPHGVRSSEMVKWLLRAFECENRDAFIFLRLGFPPIASRPTVRGPFRFERALHARPTDFVNETLLLRIEA